MKHTVDTKHTSLILSKWKYYSKMANWYVLSKEIFDEPNEGKNDEHTT